MKNDEMKEYTILTDDKGVVAVRKNEVPPVLYFIHKNELYRIYNRHGFTEDRSTLNCIADERSDKILGNANEKDITILFGKDVSDALLNYGEDFYSTGDRKKEFETIKIE